MTRKIRPASPSQVLAVETAIGDLRLARTKLEVARCPKAADKVRLALKSAEGALRHIHHRAMRTQEDI